MLIYIVLMLACYILLQIFVFPYETMFPHVLPLNILYIIQAGFFLKASFMDPGYMEPVEDVQFYKLVQNCGNATALCPNCKLQRNETSEHCEQCGRCIADFDHHCNWINNCVGGGNHKYYYLYILTLDIYFWYLVVISFVNIADLGLLSVEDLQKGSVYNWMGFGEYGKAEDLGSFCSLFNTKRVYSLPTDEAALKKIDTAAVIDGA